MLRRSIQGRVSPQFSYGEYGWHEHILRANESSDSEDIDPMDIDEGESSRHTSAT